MKHLHARRKLVTYLAPVFIFITGASVFLYPLVSNMIAEKNQFHTIRNYEASLAQTQRDELEALWQEAQTYNENLAGDPVHDPFVAGSGYVLPADYEQVLNVSKNGVMGYLKIDKIGVDLPIYHGTGEKELEKGAGHLEGTSLPIGGSNRHSILCAHRGLPSAELFTKLDKMSIGDIFLIHILNETLAYEVDDIKVIAPEELDSLQVIEGNDLVTLMTCTPYGVNTQRLLVRGSRIPYEKLIEKEDSSENLGWKQAMVIGVTAGVVLLSISGCYILRKKRIHET